MRVLRRLDTGRINSRRYRQNPRRRVSQETDDLQSAKADLVCVDANLFAQSAKADLVCVDANLFAQSVNLFARYWMLGLTGGLAIALSYFPFSSGVFAQPIPLNSPTVQTQSTNIRRLASSVTVRILTETASGSGVIVQRQGQTYTVLTNWHVVEFSDRPTILAPDGRRYTLASAPRRLGNTDLAITRFRSTANYPIARVSTAPIVVGESVFAAGFPMYQSGTLNTTFDRGIRAFQFTTGEVSLLPPKSLSQGYRLGYTNDIEVGMSGGPIFNTNGLLIGINGRVKYRDPDFGVYSFEDGSEPSPAMLEQMVNSSWGIPISTYLQFV